MRGSMATLSSRQDLKEYALRALGHPVIEINVTNEQLEDRLDEAISAYIDGHMDGSYHGYLIVSLTEDDIAVQGVPIPNAVCDVIRIIAIDSSTTYDTLFDLNYRLGGMMTGALMGGSALTDVNRGGESSVASIDGLETNYTITSGYLQDLQNLMDTKPSFMFNRNKDHMLVEMDWSTVKPGFKLVLEVTLYIDQNVDSSMWSDNWLKSYTIALFQLQWGRNLQLFSQYQLPGGMVLDGDKILSSAVERVAELKDALNKSNTRPLGFMVG